VLRSQLVERREELLFALGLARAAGGGPPCGRPSLRTPGRFTRVARRIAQIGSRLLLAGVHHCATGRRPELLSPMIGYMQLQGRLSLMSLAAEGTLFSFSLDLLQKKRRGTERSVPRSFPSRLRVGQPVLSVDTLDRRPPRDASPPLRPAILASSLVNSCAVPFWCAARPPLAAIARCA
jgi:hypothetical protein